METFTEFKPPVDSPLYEAQRDEALKHLDIDTIDSPLVGIIHGFSELPYCFTLQSCFGHFVYGNLKDSRNIDPLPRLEPSSRVQYSIAYIALCIQNGDRGKLLLEDLKTIPFFDPEYVQFGCAEWFWQTHVNSYVLQVEPIRHKKKDKVSISYEEALQVEKVRNKFFNVLEGVVQKRVVKKQLRSQGIKPAFKKTMAE